MAKSDVAVTTVCEGQYNGFPMLILPVAGKPNNPIQLGVKKVAAVLAHLDAARAFVAKHEVKPAQALAAQVAAMSAADRAALKALLGGV
jgi:hypothetical protein